MVAWAEGRLQEAITGPPKPEGARHVHVPVATLLPAPSSPLACNPPRSRCPAAAAPAAPAVPAAAAPEAPAAQPPSRWRSPPILPVPRTSIRSARAWCPATAPSSDASRSTPHISPTPARGASSNCGRRTWPPLRIAKGTSSRSGDHSPGGREDDQVPQGPLKGAERPLQGAGSQDEGDRAGADGRGPESSRRRPAAAAPEKK